MEGFLQRVSTLGSASHPQGARPNGVAGEALLASRPRFRTSSLPSTVSRAVLVERARASSLAVPYRLWPIQGGNKPALLAPG